MAGWTNRGKYQVLGHVYRAVTLPTNFQAILCTSATTPTADINTLSELTQIAAGNGYSAGGLALAKNSTDFDVYTEDDTNDRALMQAKDLVWTASGGPIPASGNGARWLVLADGTAAGALIYHFWDLAADRTVSTGQALTIQDAEIRLTE